MSNALFMGFDIFTMIILCVFGTAVAFFLTNFMGYKRYSWFFIPAVIMAVLTTASMFHLFPTESMFTGNTSFVQEDTTAPICTQGIYDPQSNQCVLSASVMQPTPSTFVPVEEQVWNQRIKEYYGNVS